MQFQFARFRSLVVAAGCIMIVAGVAFSRSSRRSSNSNVSPRPTNTLARTFLPQATSEESSDASSDATHKQAYTIKPTIKGKSVSLQSFCVGPKGQLWMACRINSDSAVAEAGQLMVYEPDGKLIHSYSVSFVPQAINFSPNNKLYIAGSGKIARVSLDGKEEIVVDAPNIGNRKEAIASARRAEEEMAKKRNSSYTDQDKAGEDRKKVIEGQIARLEKDLKEANADDKRVLERRIEMLQKLVKQPLPTPVAIRKVSDEDVLKRLLRSTAIAATESEVFVSCPETSGYGYGVWRLSSDLKVNSQVVEGGRGCCGQFDIQTDGKNLFLAENTKFQVGVYDRNGKALSSFGKKSRTDIDGFGSCCNPMNLCCRADGEILTAESSIGHIKRFDCEGKFLGFVGTATVAGGCKHVAIGFDSARNYYYMMHQDLSHVAVLVPKEKAPSVVETAANRNERDVK